MICMIESYISYIMQVFIVYNLYIQMCIWWLKKNAQPKSCEWSLLGSASLAHLPAECNNIVQKIQKTQFSPLRAYILIMEICWGKTQVALLPAQPSVPLMSRVTQPWVSSGSWAPRPWALSLLLRMLSGQILSQPRADWGAGRSN